MTITRLDLKNFRLFKNPSFNLSDGINLIYGKNGSGKTSLLEAIIVAHGKKSFRTPNLINCIKTGESSFKIGVLDEINEGSIKLEAVKSSKKRVVFKKSLLNKKIGFSEYRLLPQIINDKSFKLVEGEREIRRDFIKYLLFHVKPQFKTTYNKYDKSMKQRNRALRDNRNKSEIAFWTEAVIEHGVLLGKEQNQVFKEFNEIATKRISCAKKEYKLNFLEEIKVDYLWGWKKGKSLKAELKDSLAKDLINGRTSFGPHRADIIFSQGSSLVINSMSRGQLKLLILLIFLSVQDFLKQKNLMRNLLMIDDLGSELDFNNLVISLREILKTNEQALITSTGTDWINHISLNDFNINKISV